MSRYQKKLEQAAMTKVGSPIIYEHQEIYEYDDDDDDDNKE